MRAVLVVRHEPNIGPVPVSIFPAEAFDADQRNKIAFKAMILLARESTHDRVFPMSFEEIDAIALLALDRMPNLPTYFAVLAIFDVRKSMVLIDKFDRLEKLIIEAGRNVKSGSNPEEVVKELYAQITGLATASVSVAATASEDAADTNVTRASKLKDFLASLKGFNELINESNSSITESIKQMVKLLNDEVAKLTEALEGGG